MDETKEALLKELIGTPEFGETVKDYLKNSENGKTIFKSLTDSSVAKGIDTWKSNNLQKMIDDEISKRYPAESETDKKLRELEARLEAKEREALIEKNKNQAMTFANENGIPVKLVNYCIGADWETTLSNLEDVHAIWKESTSTEVTKEVENRFKGNGRTPNINPNGNAVDEDKMDWGEILKKHNLKG